MITNAAFLISLSFSMASMGPADQIEPDGGKDRKVVIDQIGPPEKNQKPANYQITREQTQSREQADVKQLPGDLEAADDGAGGPEKAIVQPVESPEAKLFSKVAEVWQVIRQRGQQPTPELIAREIGPDALASFLDQNPGAETIFGQDSDQLPLEEPIPTELPGGGAVIIPPTSGGGS